MEHSPPSATGTAWDRTPWHAAQRAAPYFSGTLKPDPETKGTTIVGSFGLRPGVRDSAVFFVVCALIATGVSFLLREWRLLIIPGITAIPFAAPPVTRWTCRDDPSEITAFLTATLQATDEGKR